MSIWGYTWRMLGAVSVAALLAWLYLSPPARDCSERGGRYYLNGECGVFVWQPR